MHDPLTVAHEITWPLRRRRQAPGKSQHQTWILTVWHKDPEKGGSDDSCGWSYPEVPAEAPWFQALVLDVAQANKKEQDNGSPKRNIGLYMQYGTEGHHDWWLLWLHRASFFHRDRPLSPREATRVTYSHSFPGNRDDLMILDDPRRVAWILARVYLQIIRPWWRHPRWHVRHWRLQWHQVQDFKRWAFSRCAGCGRGFTWGYSPSTTSWNGTGPLWFRREQNVYHSQCQRSVPTPAQVSKDRGAVNMDIH